MVFLLTGNIESEFKAFVTMSCVNNVVWDFLVISDWLTKTHMVNQGKDLYFVFVTLFLLKVPDKKKMTVKGGSLCFFSKKLGSAVVYNDSNQFTEVTRLLA